MPPPEVPGLAKRIDRLEEYLIELGDHLYKWHMEFVQLHQSCGVNIDRTCAGNAEHPPWGPPWEG